MSGVSNEQSLAERKNKKNKFHRHDTKIKINHVTSDKIKS